MKNYIVAVIFVGSLLAGALLFWFTYQKIVTKVNRIRLRNLHVRHRAAQPAANEQINLHNRNFQLEEVRRAIATSLPRHIDTLWSKV